MTSKDDSANGTTPSWPEVDTISSKWPLYLDPPQTIYTALKPSIDLIVAACLLPILLPFIAIAWVLTKLSSRGPGFYVQSRSGFGGRPYHIVKIRSMKSDEATARDINWAKQGDSRITRIGTVLRALHLDELPQVFNVLRGEMSLVGPRPERPEVIASKGLNDEVPGYALRMQARPGVTGLAQVQLPPDSDIVGVRHKVCYDLYYLANQSLWLDIRICAATVLKAFLSPAQLQKFLFLPSRECVCEQFLAWLQPGYVEQDSTATPATIV